MADRRISQVVPAGNLDPDTAFFSMLQGEQRLVELERSFDLTNYDIKAVATFNRVDVRPTATDPGITNRQDDPTPDLELTVRKRDQTIAMGFADMLIPSNFYTGDIALDSNQNLPLANIFITYIDKNVNPNQELKFRMQVLIRNGGPDA